MSDVRVSLPIASSMSSSTRRVSAPRASCINACDGTFTSRPFTTIVRPSSYAISRGRKSARKPSESVR